LNVRGKFIEAQHLGPRAGPTLVFLHEGLGSLGLWRGLPEFRWESSLRVWAYAIMRHHFFHWLFKRVLT
jgi:pimeloyl-ACP methyl ester carboxylesterase